MKPKNSIKIDIALIKEDYEAIKKMIPDVKSQLEEMGKTSAILVVDEYMNSVTYFYDCILDGTIDENLTEISDDLDAKFEEAWNLRNQITKSTAKAYN